MLINMLSGIHVSSMCCSEIHVSSMGWQHSRSSSVRPTTLQQRRSWRCSVRCSARHHCCDESTNSRPKPPGSIAECAATTAALETLSHVNAVIPSWSYRTCGCVQSDVWPEQGDPILYWRCSVCRGLQEICRAECRAVLWCVPSWMFSNSGKVPVLHIPVKVLITCGWWVTLCVS